MQNRRHILKIGFSLAAAGLAGAAALSGARRSVAEAGETLRREIGGSSLPPDKLHARVKTAGLKAPAARETALVQAKDPRPPAAGAPEKRPRTAVGETTQRQANNEFDVAKRDGRGFRVRADRA
jgi:hypothetical protein